MNEYRHRQHGTLICVLVGITIVFCLSIAIMGYISGEYTGSTISLAVSLILALALVLFGSLTVTVSSAQRKCSFWNWMDSIQN